MLYVCVCLLMKSSVIFYPDNDKFTQKIHEYAGRVINYIRPKMVENWLKNPCNMLGRNEIVHKMLEMWQDLYGT